MSQITDHHVFAKMVRYSDGEKQSELSNESQDDNTTRGVLRQVPEAQFPFTFSSAHTGTDPDRWQLEDALKKIKAYNRRSARPITCLILWRWDRWFRNSFASVDWVGRFNEIGVEVNTVERWIDFDQVTDKMLFFLEQAAAEKVSKDISDHTKRNQVACLERGYYPYRTSKRYQRKINDDLGRRIKWLPAAEILRVAGVEISHGAGINQAWQANGGRAVLGPIQSFRDSLGNERYQGRVAGVKLNFAPLWEEYDWVRLQKELRTRRVLTKNLKSLSDSFLRGIVYGSPCNVTATSSTVKNGSGKKTSYYVCKCKGVTHYRFRRNEVDEDLRNMVKELTYKAVSQLRLSNKAKKRMQQQTANLRSELKRKKNELIEAEDLVKKSVKFLLQGAITTKEKQDLEADVLRLTAHVTETQMLLDRQGEVLQHVLQSIAGIGAVLSKVESNLQLRDFVQMAFPEGLQYIPEKRIFRATRMNAALSTTDAGSVSYSLIQIGAAANATTPITTESVSTEISANANTPVKGGKPGDNRTAKEDIIALRAYCFKYQISA